MIIIKKIGSKQLHSQGLDDQIIKFDRENMVPILALKGISFPEEKRRKGFEVDGTFHLAFDQDGQLVGYLEYCPDWNDVKAIYISSMQIAPIYRNT